MTTYAALNTDTTLNPTEGNAYFEVTSGTALVLRKIDWKAGGGLGSARVVLTGAGPDEYQHVGDRIVLIGDQSRRRMGDYKVVGIVKGGTVSGDVPSRKMRHYVMK